MPKGQPDQPQVVKVSDVLIGEADWLKKGLAERLESPEVAERVFTWLRGRAADHADAERRRDQARQGQGRRRGRAGQVHHDIARRRAGHRRQAADEDDTCNCSSSSTRPISSSSA